jgi:serine/threonine-protein kinase
VWTDADDFPQLDSLLDAALDRPPAERARFLAEACGNDLVLRKRLDRLLRLAEGGEDVLPPSGGLRGPVWDEFAREIGEAQPELNVGQRLGRYELRGLLGVGGMGHVYRGFDPALGREVAIKALAVALQGDASDLRRRLEREARLLATLNHPNVGAIYGFEVIEGAPYLILELVEGPTLAERLKKGPLPVESVVAIGLQMASALEAAHRKGVVHRDLKPANVKLGPEGRVKVLDFGIAKPVAQGPEETMHQASAAATTGPGAILGTAPYMSPEQIRGEPVDTRTDVWAFGCVVYEMLVGRALFPGPSSAEVMAAILRDDADWTALPENTPAGLRRVLRRCLRRDPRERLQDMGDARLELAEIERDEDLPAPVPARSRAARARALLPWLVAGAGVAAALVVWLARPGKTPSANDTTRLSLELPAGITVADDFANPFAVPPDGSRVVVLATEEGRPRLYVRDVGALEAAPVGGTEGAWQPFLSPDGREVAFFADRKLKRVSLDGGPVMTLAEIGGNPRGGTWAEDGTIILSPSLRSGLARVDTRKGGVVPLTQLDVGRGEGSHRWPQILPGGRWVLFTAGLETTFDEARIEAVSLASGERRVLVEGGSYGRYAGGRLFFAREGRLFAVPFDPQRVAVRGTPEVVVEGVRYDPRSGSACYALSDNGTLVYGAAPPTSREHYLAWVDEAGRLTRIGDAARQFREPRLSPDGRRIATRIGTAAESDVWIVDAESATLSRLTSGLSPHRPVWTPDGRGLTVGVDQDGRWKLVTLSATGPAARAAILETANRVYPNAWSPDGRFLVFQELNAATGWDLRVLEVGPQGAPVGTPRTLLATRFDERNAAFSPDGRFLAYESNEPDYVFEVQIVPFTEPGAKIWGTVTGARWARWGSAGQLYYWRPTQARPGDSKVPEGLHRIDWRPDAGRLAVARAAAVWGEGHHVPEPLGRVVVALYASYDVDLSARGPRFLVLESSADPEPAPLRRPVVVLNAFGDLRPRDGRR